MRGHERPRVRAVCAVWVVSIAALIALGVSAQAGAEASDPPSLSCPPAPQWSQSDVSCSVSGGSSYASAISSDDPSLQWRLGEGSGTVAADASGHGHAGTYNGGHTLGQSGALAGSSDPASDFDGTNGRVNSTYNPFANGGQITIEGWANRDTSTTDDSLFGGNGSAPPRLLISAGSNDVRFRPVPSNGAEQLWTNAWPGTGQWVHWAVVLSESPDTAELFINGASKGTRTVSQAYATTPGSFEAGASGSTNNPFDGRLDEVAVYEHGLSAARIAAHHDAGRAPSGAAPGFDYRTALGGGAWSAWGPVQGSSVPVTDEGRTHLEARMSDVAGNVASTSETIKIDKADPTPSLDCPPAPEWSTTDVTCTVSGEDSVYSDAIQTDDPSLQWRLGEGSGTVAADASGHGHAGTYNGGHTLGQSGALAGSSDPASDFDGTNGRVNSTYNPFANGGQITIEGWANRDTSTTDDSLFGGNGSAPPRLLISAGSNDVRFRPVPSNGAEQLWTNAWPGTGQWVHWAVVLSESPDTAELFINGASKGTRTVSQAYATTPGSFEAGASGSTNNPFDGRLDEVAVYEHGLSAARIAAHHDAGRAPSGAAPGFDYRTALGGGAWSAWGPVQGSSVPVTDEGRTHLEARMSDVAGNVASTSETIKIDKADPTPSLDCPPAPEWSTTDVTCTVSGEDSVYSDAIQTDDPSLQWRLGEGSGTVAADASGHGHAGTYNGGHTLGQSGALAGSSDPASDFDGTNGRVNSTYNPFANGGQITIEGWANRDTNTTDDTLFGGTGSSPPRLKINTGSNDVSFRPIPTDTTAHLWTNAWPGTGQWVHWAVVLSESTDTAELFINGASKGTRTVSQAYAETPGDFQAGASGNTNNPFDGKLDEVAVYEHGLSAARIAAHYQAGLESGLEYTDGGTCSSWCSIDAGEGFVVADDGTTPVEARLTEASGRQGSASETVRVDTAGPLLTPSGELTDSSNPLIGLSTEVDVDATDAQSGVVSAQILVDGQQEDVLPQDCPEGGCELQGSLVPGFSDLGPGEHSYQIVAKDAAGNETQQSGTFTLDPTPPVVTMSGDLADVNGQPMTAATASADLQASDNATGDSGIAALDLSVDDDVVQTDDQNCTSACPPTASSTYSYTKDDWDQGSHTVTVTATDAAGNEQDTSVEVDVQPPRPPAECPQVTPTVQSSGEVVSTTDAADAAPASALASSVPADDPNSEDPEDPNSGDTIDPSLERPDESPPTPLDATGTSNDDQVPSTPAGDLNVNGALCLVPVQTTPDETPAAVVNSDSAIYANSASDTDTVIRPTAEGEVVIESPRSEDAPAQFSWKTGIPTGDQLQELADGGVAVVNPNEAAPSDLTVPDEPQAAEDPNEIPDAATQLAEADYLTAKAEQETGDMVDAVIAPPYT